MTTQFARMVQRADTAATWAALNPVLMAGELGYDTDTDLLKVGNGVAAWQDLPPLSAAALTSYTRRAGALEAFMHSYGTTGASAADYYPQKLLARRMGATLTDRAISGSKFITGNPGTNCGYATMLQNMVPTGARTPLNKSFTPNLGVAFLMEGLNSGGDATTNTGAEQAEAVNAWANTVRSMLSRWQASMVFESTETTYTALGGAGWATFGSTNQNSGTGYSQNSNPGATVTVSIPAGFKGGTVALFFVANRIGGTVPASDLTFAVDGSPAHPIGYPGTFSTKNQSPTASSAGTKVARFELAPGAHTIVVTSGAGGIAYDCFTVEADTPRPAIWCGQPRTPLSTATTRSAVDAMNAATEAIVADEFRVGVGIYVPPVCDELDEDLFSDGTHLNDQGYALTAEAALLAWNTAPVIGHQLIYA